MYQTRKWRLVMTLFGLLAPLFVRFFLWTEGDRASALDNRQGGSWELASALSLIPDPHEFRGIEWDHAAVVEMQPLTPPDRNEASELVSFQPGRYYELPSGIPDKSSPTMADLTGDGVPEVLIGTTSFNGATSSYNRPSMLVAMRGDGSLLWARDLGAPINSSPAVGDINQDGQPEVVVGVGADVFDMQRQGGVVALDRSGNQLWRFNTQDFYPRDGFSEGVYGSPTLCDVDGNGSLEIAFGSWDQRIYLLDNQGRSLWNNLPAGATGPGFLNADSVWSTAACADLNRDGKWEIVIGADITGGGILPDGTVTQNGGFLYVFDRFGNILVRRFLPEAIYSSPAVADLDRDGTLEIVTGTGWYWWYVGGRRSTSAVYVFETEKVFSTLRYDDPGKLPDSPGWPQRTELPGFSSPALVDMDGNLDLEIVIGTGDPLVPNDGINGAGSVYAWHHTGQVVSGWPIYPKNMYGDDTAIFSSPTAADIDGDGRMEILFSMIWDIQVYEADGRFQERLPTLWTVWASPAIGDADGDGSPEVWIGGSKADGDPSKGYLWSFEQTISREGVSDWTQFHRDSYHTGTLGSPLSFNSGSIFLYRDPDGANAPLTTSLTLRNGSDIGISWQSVSASSRLRVAPVQGAFTGVGQQSLSISVDSSGLQQGTHALGTVEVDGTAGGNPFDSIGVPVYLVIGDVSRLYLPLTR